MTRDEVLALFARRQEAFDRFDAAALARDYTEDGIVESPVAGGTVIGPAAVEKTHHAFFTGFPDLKTETDDLVIDGDRVAWFFTASGTDRGGFMGLPPTGKAFRVPIVFLYVLRDSKIVKERRIYDFTGVLVQVGLLKAKHVSTPEPRLQVADSQQSRAVASDEATLPNGLSGTADLPVVPRGASVPMTREEVAALFACRQASYDRLDAAALAGDHADDGVVESPMAGGTITGRAAIEKGHHAFFTAFPDLKFQTDDLLIDGDRVAWFATMSGTDRGDLMGLPPTGKAFRVPVVVFYVLRYGVIVSERRIYDFTGLLVQVGLLKAKPV